MVQDGVLYRGYPSLRYVVVELNNEANDMSMSSSLPPSLESGRDGVCRPQVSARFEAFAGLPPARIDLNREGKGVRRWR